MFIAEREGFEPPVPLSTAVFKTAVIDHSTISPYGIARLRLETGCKNSAFFRNRQISAPFFSDSTYF